MKLMNKIGRTIELENRDCGNALRIRITVPDLEPYSEMSLRLERTEVLALAAALKAEVPEK